MVHIFLSPLPSVSSSTALLLVIVEKDGGESVYPQIIPTLAVSTHQGSQRQWAVKLKGEEEYTVVSHTVVSLHGDRWVIPS